MKALVYRAGTMIFEPNYPSPVLHEGESLVRISLAAVCSTDMEVRRGYKPDFEGIMGHEFVGVVEKSDNAGLVGKRVVGELNSGCGHCGYCTSGRESHCLERRVPGLSRKDGCFAEYMAYDTRLLHVVPDNLADEQAIFCEPLAAALEVPEQNHLRPSQEVAIIGDGRLALMLAQVIAANGTPIMVFGRHTEKLALFAPYGKTQIGSEGFDQGFEVVVEATGRPEGLAEAIRLVRSRGRLVLKSTYAGTAQVNMSEIVVREITVTGSRCGPFPSALNMLARGLIHLPPIQLYPLKQYEDAFSSPAFKAGFNFTHA